MTFETIITCIVAAAPSLIAIVGIITAVVKFIAACKDSNKELKTAFDSLKQEVVDTKQFDELKAELAETHRENRALKRHINELLTSIDKVQRGE